MKQLFDQVSNQTNRRILHAYNKSFSLATKLLSKDIRNHICNLYGVLRCADEIVDSFTEYDQEYLLDGLYYDVEEAIKHKISLNPILNAFQDTFYKCNLSTHLIHDFMKGMYIALKKDCNTAEAYNTNRFIAANSVGLMSLHIFVYGDKTKFKALKEGAIALSNALQKINILQDLNSGELDKENLFIADLKLKKFDVYAKDKIICDIEEQLKRAYRDIKRLPKSSRLGVYVIYKYSKKLLSAIKDTPISEVSSKIHVTKYKKSIVVASAYVQHKLNIL
ncbi:squalene/phytoene synthase family protein [uncultured Croceitalea sp.]|uniref:phytoene/squalene synthase family protein n=1 Tax=uncultured Croceitalea sp. TaxID=1798908 RepID=UPI003305AD21